MLVSLALGCHGHDSDPTAAARVESVTCAPTDNALRFACSASLDAAAPATWTVREGDAVVRTFATPASSEPTLTLWGLAPEADYTVEVDAGDEPGTTSLTTGALPAELGALAITVTGAADGVDAVVFPQECDTTAWMLVVGVDGRVRWYDQLLGETADTLPSIGGYAWTPDDHLLVGLNFRSIREMTAAGDTVWTVEDFDRPVHHGLEKGGDYVYALDAAVHDNKIVDGFYVIDHTGAVVASWDLADHVTVTGTGGGVGGFWDRFFPGSEDWSHANSIWSDGHVVILSFLRQNAVMAVAADPDSADFGTILWTLTGNAASDLTSDFTWTDGGSFDGQHGAVATPTGLALFDNGPTGADSRALELVLDEAAGTVAEGPSWSMGEHCKIHGAAFPVGDGVVATCATDSYVAQFAAASDPIWTLRSACGANDLPVLARAIPIPLR
jgi:hypothetical protein